MVLNVAYIRLISVFLFLFSCVGVSLAQGQDMILRRLDSIANPSVLRQDLTFDSESVDAGEFPDTLCPEFTFHYRNTGSTPVVITMITGSCSCLEIRCDRRTLQPDEDGTILARYSALGHIGKMSHRIFVYTNHSNSRPAARLQLGGYVVSTQQYPGFRLRMGSLLVKQQLVDFGQITRSVCRVERILCVNSGTDTLTLGILSPVCDWLEIYTEPRSLPPGAEGDLVVVADGRKIPASMSGKQVFKASLKGIQARFTERRLDIEMTLID